MNERNGVRKTVTTASQISPAAARPLGSRWWMVSALLMLAGLAQQALILSEGWRGNPFAAAPVQDAEVYWDWAGEVAAGQLLRTTPFMSAPLYPYLLGVIRALGGGLLTVYILQAGLHLLTIGLLAHLAARRFGPGIGLLAGLLFILLIEPAYFPGRILNCTLQALLIVLLWQQLVNAQQRSSRAHWTIVGGLAGLNCLANPPMLPAVLLIAFWCWWQSGFARRGLADTLSPARSLYRASVRRQSPRACISYPAAPLPQFPTHWPNIYSPEPPADNPAEYPTTWPTGPSPSHIWSQCARLFLCE